MMKNTCEISTPLSDLSSELWSDILLRLPVKDLLKLRCICKLWCSIIDSRYFMSLNLRHYHKRNKNNNLLMIDLSFKPERFECILTVRSRLDFKIYSELYRISESFMIHGSCKELMLITKGSHHSRDYGNENTEKMLWNPSIGKALLLPTCPLCRNHKDDLFGFLLGFSPSQDDFKLAAFRFNEGQPMDVSIAIYSLRNHGWKPEFKRVSVLYMWFLSKYHIPLFQVFSLGVSYWMGNDQRKEYYLEDEDEDEDEEYDFDLETHLISFHFDSEEFSFIELPDAGDKKVKRRFIFLLGESVAVFSVSYESSCVWVLEKNVRFSKKPWKVWPSTEANFLNQNFVECVDAEPRIFYDEDGDTFLMHSNNSVISYNRSTDRIQYLMHKSCAGRFFLEPYVESLVLHKGTSGQSTTSFP